MNSNSWRSTRATLLASAGLLSLVAGCGGGGTTIIFEPDACQRLRSQSLGDIVLEQAHHEDARDGYPRHCLAQGHTLDGRVAFEVRMPQPEDWNSRLLVQGGGGYAGQLDPALGVYRSGADTGLLAHGYAVVTTDTGHTGNQTAEVYYQRFLDGSWGLNAPQAETDFAWRGMRAATLAAQRIVAAYEDGRSYRTYYVGCSGGGRQGLKMAERAAELFDGFVIGDPTFAFTRDMTRMHWNRTTLQVLPLPYAKVRLIERAVIGRCDALDGAADGIVSNPLACSFNPFELQCSGADAPNCLTPDEAVAAFRIYSGAQDSAGHQITFGLPASGAEACSGLCDGSVDGNGHFREGWPWWFTGGVPSGLDTGDETKIPLTLDRTFGFVLMDQFLRYLAYTPDRPDATWYQFDPANQIAGLDAAQALYDVQRVDFSDFRASGKRVLMYSGWGDALVSPLGLIDYYDRVTRASGGAAATQSMFRLFMVPGMQHCEGGKALDYFDAVTPLVRWVEDGVAPDTLRASNRYETGFVGRERDLCAYPKVSVYRGRGSFDDPASFECRAP